MHKLEIRNLEKNFKGQRAVSNINLVFENGIYGLLGENGAGKSTLMQLISGVLQETKGEILCDGMDIKKSGEKYRSLLGYLPQEFGYYPDYSARQFLRYIAYLKDLSGDAAENRVLELLDVVGLSEAKDKKLKSFSGGMLRRVGIAQTLLNNPSILILDEPTSGLDPKERVRFRNIISTLGKERIVLLSTHIVTDIEYIADKIIVMKKGTVIAQGSIEEIVRPLENHVWECETEKNIEEIEAQYIVSNLKTEGEISKLRILSKEKPAGKAFCVKPTLEDAYLFYLHREEKYGNDGEVII